MQEQEEEEIEREREREKERGGGIITFFKGIKNSLSALLEIYNIVSLLSS